MPDNIIVVSGGSGSTFLQRKLDAHKRPDVVFEPHIKPMPRLTDYPSRKQAKEFKERSQGIFNLDLSKTIEDNMVAYLRFMSKRNEFVIINGRISRIGRIFSKHKIKNVICLIRHPLHGMVSLLMHRHPEKVERFSNGFNSESCVEYYAKLWNETVGDQLDAGNKIIRFEHAAKDSAQLNNAKLVRIFRNTWDPSKRNFNELKPEFDRMLEKLVKDYYYQLYDKWII